MKLTGADLVVKALEAEGVRWTFGIPGTHNTELYDALERSEQVTPMLVTDEQCASFMADGVSRTSDQVGVANVVPGAGVTHCLSGVGEAFMDNVPLVVLATGMRRDTGKSYQLHHIDQLAILRPITKAAFRPERPEDIYPIVRQAFAIARSGTPGPVAVEIPANFFLFSHEIGPLSYDGAGSLRPPEASSGDLDQAARLLEGAAFPALYIGNGAKACQAELIELAEKLGAPVVTTVQGKGVFPEHHPLWLWNTFGNAAPAFVRNIMDRADCLLAIGCRFGEVATASYGLQTPENLIHVDINKDVFHKNYPAKLAVESDAGVFVRGLLERLKRRPQNAALKEEIRRGHEDIWNDWRQSPSKERVTPSLFLSSLQKILGPDAIYATDSGNGTFVAMEMLRLDQPGCFIGPIDYSCMGYSVPAAIGAKLVNPDRPVAALAGDGALLMTGLELMSASHYGIAPLIFVLRDGELSQIVQFQRTSLNRDTCSVLHPYDLEALAKSCHAHYCDLPNDAAIDKTIHAALEKAKDKKPVVINVAIDYSQKTFFTKGVVKTNLWRLPWSERLRMLGRAAYRHLIAR
ncbi:MAG: thiamine pyrophosphate-binding protein [Elusimicrobia bacterium]|nr:thiamine pyrophosphate-binding protein [Elusimicrobiota bacterium]